MLLTCVEFGKDSRLKLASSIDEPKTRTSSRSDAMVILLTVSGSCTKNRDNSGSVDGIPQMRVYAARSPVCYIGLDTSLVESLLHMDISSDH